MIAALVVSSIGLSFAGLDAPPPPTFAGLDAMPARAIVRKASLRRPVEDAAPAFPARPALARTLAPAPARYQAPPVYYYPVSRPVYVGGFYPSYGYSAGSCASGNCARR